MIAYIDTHKDDFEVEPICNHLPIAPFTCYEAKARPEGKCAVSDAVTKEKIKAAHQDNYSIYEARKIYATLSRAGLHGVRIARGTRTTATGPPAERPAALVRRQFTAPVPNCLWVAGF